MTDALVVLAACVISVWMLASFICTYRHHRYFNQVLIPYLIRDGDRDIKRLDEFLWIATFSPSAIHQDLNLALRVSEIRLVKIDMGLKEYISQYKWLILHPWRSPENTVDAWLREEIAQE